MFSSTHTLRSLALLTAALVGLFASPAVAATINVGTTQDMAFHGPCSLREAVTAANTGAPVGACPAGDPNGTRIVLPSGHYVLSAGELLVGSSITIVGQGAGATTIDGLGLSRLFEVGSIGNLTLSNLTLTGGRAPDGANATSSAPAAPGGGGGAITSRGFLTLDHVAVVGNQAGNGGTGQGFIGATYYPAVHGGNGGAIESSGPSLTIVDSTVAYNHAGDGGMAGFFHYGGPGGNGGGIDATAGAVTIRGSTISANRAGNGFEIEGTSESRGGNGGGLALSDPAPGTLANDTIAGNTAGHAADAMIPFSDGGAISQTRGQLTLTHVTVAGNTEDDWKIEGNISTTGAMTISDSALEATCHGPVTDGGHNFTLIPSDLRLYYHQVCPGKQLPAPAFDLGPLQSNGGSTQTILPQPGSPLIDAVPRNAAGCLASDQRGVARPQGPACDAGAVEVRVPAMAAQPRPVRFGPMHVGHARRMTVRLRVTAGELPLNIGKARITGRNARDFAIVKNRYRGKALNPGQSCTLVISFRPHERGLRTAKVTLNVQSPGAAVRITLIGTGMA